MCHNKQAKMQKYATVSRPFSALVPVLIFACLAVSIQGKRQADALGRLYRSKFRGSSGINTNAFEAIEHVDVSKFHPQDGLKERDRIDRLPGQPEVGFSQYGGYVTVDKSAGRAFYYYFAEARYSKETLPLVLWLNGGPGCSSLAYGAMEELGPFRVYSDGKTLYKNRYSWNYAANVLFLESPAGVGFSYSNTTSDYDNSIGDSKTAEDNYVFLVNWLERFPEYKGRDFYLTGESYAGHYVPQLAHTILHHNKKADKTIINLKGIMIGNAAIDDETDNGGMYDYLGTHAIISEEDAQDVRTYCDFSPSARTQSSRCDAAMLKIDRDIYNIDIYNLYAPNCFARGTTAKPRKLFSTDFDPCSDYYVYAYLNRPEVQKALHANVTKLTHDWQPCSDILGRWLDSASTVLPVLQELMDSGLRVWLFSGDMDGRVPVTSTQYAINAMKLPIKTRWHPWYISGEVGGYTQVYKGDLTFATVRGAGHEVPSYQPLRSLALLKHFLDGTPLPDTARYY